MDDINPIVWIIAIIGGCCAIGTLVLAGIDKWCERRNKRSPYRYWCVTCKTGTAHVGNKCQGCS